MTDHRNVNAAPVRPIRSLRFGHGLEDHAQFFAKFIGNNPPGEAVQSHKAIGKLQGAKRRLRIFDYVVIDIRAAELKDERARWIARLETVDRAGAAPGMNSNHRIGRLIGIVGGDRHAVAELSQNACPALCRNAVAGACTRSWWRDKDDLHGSKSVRAADE